MKNLWDSKKAAQFSKNILQMRVYSSRLLGENQNLVLHGGGNTSVKLKGKNFFGDEEEFLIVKGSGVNLATIESDDFSKINLKKLIKLVELEDIDDVDLVSQQRLAMNNANSLNPSIEAILHAIIPFDWVDHTHADAVVTITNTPSGGDLIRELYGDRIIAFPYVKPGFKLARKVFKFLKDVDLANFEGLILLNHGIFTFGRSAKESYDRMIGLVSEAEKFLEKKSKLTFTKTKKKSTKIDKQKDVLEKGLLLQLAFIRRKVSEIGKTPILAEFNKSNESLNFSKLPNVKEISIRGPITSDHLIHTKPFPSIIESKNLEGSIENFALEYESYFARHTKGLSKIEKPNRLDSAPRWAIWPGKGTISFGKNLTIMRVVEDIVEHTIRSIQLAENLKVKGFSGGWKPVSEKHLFEAEYWELQQKKLETTKNSKVFQNKFLEFEGKIAIVTGAASGIGLACAIELDKQGSVVVGLDSNPEITKIFSNSEIQGIHCDVTDQKNIRYAVAKTIEKFGGLDILILNAGTFPAGKTIEEMDENTWSKSMEINLNASQKLLQVCVPFLKEGIDPTIIFMASRNVLAPGPGASAYSVPKAGQTQLARIAALELGKFGIRVNILHPDCVYDTGLWTTKALKNSAERYGLTVEEYKSRNILKKHVTSKEVATMVCAMAGKVFAKTTGAQIPIDGGNDRVI